MQPTPDNSIIRIDNTVTISEIRHPIDPLRSFIDSPTFSSYQQNPPLSQETFPGSSFDSPVEISRQINPYEPPSVHEPIHSDGFIARLFNDCSDNDLLANMGFYLASTVIANVAAENLLPDLFSALPWGGTFTPTQKAIVVGGTLIVSIVSAAMTVMELMRRNQNSQSPPIENAPGS